MAKKMSKGLVALSSAAIVSVYGAGYALTQPAAVSMAAGQAAPAPTSTTVAATATAARERADAPASAPGSNAPAQATSPSASSAAASTTLKDGTYTGSGMSRHGGVTVKVTIQNGKIAAAPIASVSTRYSPNVISSLPGQVISKQGAQVNMVSGATDSSMAYEQAVARALAQAGGAPVISTSNASSGGSVQVTGPNDVIYSNGGGRRGRGGFYSSD